MGSQRKSFTKQLLGKYSIQYLQCISCGYVCTDEPYCLSEAYENAITSLDIGLVQRNLEYSPKIAAVIDYLILRKRNKFLDYGGGYGLFVRLMRDKGYDFYRYDIYCDNLFAKFFDYNISGQRQHFDLLTAFEVFEHIVDPVEELETMSKFSDHIFFSTELLPMNNHNIQDWWYLSAETGQHISFYTRKSLKILSEKFGYYYYTDGKYFHFFTKKKILSFLFRFLTLKKVSLILSSLKSKNNSLLQTDYQMILTKRRENKIVQS